ncbi:hypothetical protein NE236_33115 [Actinoallomurus purpureus]|nr:hypothetical protein [Actinoallomurus purpureus]MCO6009824.1 hypothetical protein [Actinoallomurus purpureus]
MPEPTWCTRPEPGTCTSAVLPGGTVTFRRMPSDVFVQDVRASPYGVR